MTLLKKLTFEVLNSAINTYTSDEIYSGDLHNISINVLSTTNATLSITWTNDDVTLITESFSIASNIFFHQILQVKASYFILELTGILGADYVLQSFYN